MSHELASGHRGAKLAQMSTDSANHVFLRSAVSIARRCGRESAPFIFHDEVDMHLGDNPEAAPPGLGQRGDGSSWS